MEHKKLKTPHVTSDSGSHRKRKTIRCQIVCITGNGLKTQNAVNGLLEKPIVINPSLEEFEPIVEGSREAVMV